MSNMDRVARHLVRAEAWKDTEAEAVTAQWWADLVIEILDELPPATAPRISELVIDYMLGVDDGTG